MTTLYDSCLFIAHVCLVGHYDSEVLYILSNRGRRTECSMTPGFPKSFVHDKFQYSINIQHFFA